MRYGGPKTNLKPKTTSNQEDVLYFNLNLKQSHVTGSIKVIKL